MRSAQSQEPTGQLESRRLTVLGALGVAVVLGAVVVHNSLSLATVSHDVAWTLYAGEQLLDGADYGVDIVELNPPLILGITTLVAGLARLVGAPVMLCYNLLVLAGIAVLSLSLPRILRAAFEHPELPVSVAFLLPPIQLLLCNDEYGQRDHLIFLLMTPHFLMAASCIDTGSAFSRGARVAAGLGTGFALCMKPHYALVWFATEFTVAIDARRFRSFWRLENATAMAFGVLQLAAVILFLPEYFTTARDAWSAYGAFNAPVPILSLKSAPVFAALVALLILRPRGAAGRCATVSTVASLASFAALLAQQKGYVYHYIPCQLYALLAIALAIGAKLDSAWGERTTRVPTGASRLLHISIALGLSLSALALAWSSVQVNPQRQALATVIETRGRGEPVLFFSSSVPPAFPVLLMTRHRSVSPYSCFWQIAGNYSVAELEGRRFPYRTLEQMPEMERRFISTIVDRMERERPRLLFFDRRRLKHSFGNAAFSFERYFEADPRFTEIMGRYRKIGVFGGYSVAVRIPERVNR